MRASTSKIALRLNAAYRTASNIRQQAVVYIAVRGLVFIMMAKTQVDERRYLIPELRRYDLLTMELLDKELHAHEVVDRILDALPKYYKQRKGSSNGEDDKCVICLEGCLC